MYYLQGALDTGGGGGLCARCAKHRSHQGKLSAQKWDIFQANFVFPILPESPTNETCPLLINVPSMRYEPTQSELSGALGTSSAKIAGQSQSGQSQDGRAGTVDAGRVV